MVDSNRIRIDHCNSVTFVEYDNMTKMISTICNLGTDGESRKQSEG